MGVVANIDIDNFPEQTENVGKKVTVCFHYDTSKSILGTIVREDRKSPTMIIRLNDGRYVLPTECQYSFHVPNVVSDTKADEGEYRGG